MIDISIQSVANGFTVRVLDYPKTVKRVDARARTFIVADADTLHAVVRQVVAEAVADADVSQPDGGVRS